MHRRVVLTGLASCLTGVLSGCLESFLDDESRDVPRFVGLEAGNWHPDPQTLNILIESDDEILYETQVHLRGGNPSKYERPPKELDGYPSDLPASATLVTWVENASRDDARTLDFGGRSTECILVEIDICPKCASQKGQEDITVPEVPDTLIKQSSNCRYSE